MVTNTTFAYEPSFKGLFESRELALNSITAHYAQHETNPIITVKPASDLPGIDGWDIIQIEYGEPNTRLRDEFEIESVTVHKQVSPEII
jgi:hypothetical protein